MRVFIIPSYYGRYNYYIYQYLIYIIWVFWKGLLLSIVLSWWNKQSQVFLSSEMILCSHGLLIGGGCGSQSCHLPWGLEFCATEQHFSPTCLLLWGCWLISHWCALSLHAVALSAQLCVSLWRGEWEATGPAASFIQGPTIVSVDGVQSLLDHLIISLAAASPHVLPVVHRLNRHRFRWMSSLSVKLPIFKCHLYFALTVLCVEVHINYTIIHIHHAVWCAIHVRLHSLPAVVGCELPSHYHQ